MTTLAVNANNDLYLDDKGNIPLLTGISAATSSAAHRSKAQKGEMLYQVEKGVNYFGSVFDRVNLSEFRDSLIENQKTTPDVVDVPSCNVSMVGGVVSYTSVLQTIYGEALLNG